jgi:hypothetical protein
VQVVGDFVEIAAVRDDGTLIESWGWGRMPDLVATAPAAVPAPAAAGGKANVALASTSVGLGSAGARDRAGCSLVPASASAGGRPGPGGLVVLAGLALVTAGALRRRPRA